MYLSSPVPRPYCEVAVLPQPALNGSVRPVLGLGLHDIDVGDQHAAACACQCNAQPHDQVAALGPRTTATWTFGSRIATPRAGRAPIALAAAPVSPADGVVLISATNSFHRSRGSSSVPQVVRGPRRSAAPRLPRRRSRSRRDGVVRHGSGKVARWAGAGANAKSSAAGAMRCSGLRGVLHHVGRGAMGWLGRPGPPAARAPAVTWALRAARRGRGRGATDARS